MAAHTADQGYKTPKVPVQHVKPRRSRSPGLLKRDFTKERSRVDDLDFEQLDWFIIEVKTGKEDVARMVCRAKGFGTCLPMHIMQKRKGRKAPSTLRSYPVLSGYMFIGMSRDTSGWPELMAPKFMLGVVGINDRPYRLDKCVIDRFLHRYQSAYYQRSKVSGEVELPTFKAGDHVKVLTGPFECHVVPVVKIKQQQAVVLIRVHGKDCAVAVRLDDLRKSA
jgi:transcription antitermination factor NusG